MVKIPKLESKYPFEHVTCYIARRYKNLQDWQIANRNASLRFMDGKLTEKDMKDIETAIRKTLYKYRNRTGKWVITFIPASTNEKYTRRYWKLTYHLRRNQDLPVAYYGICLKEKKTYAKHGEMVTEDNIYTKWHLIKVRNRNIILIDDNITTGRTLRTVGDFLMNKGANGVFGVIFSRTIHPDLPVEEGL